jgi:hypothetical protein
MNDRFHGEKPDEQGIHKDGIISFWTKRFGNRVSYFVNPPRAVCGTTLAQKVTRFSFVASPDIFPNVESVKAFLLAQKQEPPFRAFVYSKGKASLEKEVVNEEVNLRSELAATEQEWNRLTEELRCVGQRMGDLRGRLADIQDRVADEADDDDDDDDNDDQYDDGENQRHVRARHG